MSYYKHLPLLILLSLPVTAIAEPFKPYIEMHSFLLSKPTSLDSTRNQWQGKYHPNGDKQIASIWFESGLKNQNWSVGLLYREEYRLDFSNDAADLYYTVENNLDLDTNRSYDIAVDAYRFRGIGARVSKYFEPNNKLQASIGASLFSASKLLEGNLSGSALANANDEYQYYLTGDYRYTEDILFERKNIEQPTGVGLALDLNLSWRPSKKWQLDANIKDLAGAIFWKDAPYTEATANSETVQVDENGFTTVNPVLSGREGYLSSFTQKLKPVANLQIGYHLNNANYSASIKTMHSDNLNLYALGGSRPLSNGKLALHYWPQIQTLEADYQGKKYGFSLGLDKLDLSEVRTFWLSLKYR